MFLRHPLNGREPGSYVMVRTDRRLTVDRQTDDPIGSQGQQETGLELR